MFNLATKGGSEGKGVSFHEALIAAIDLAEKAFRKPGLGWAWIPACATSTSALAVCINRIL